ncbi:hypothetical protein B0H63DRAFT_458001 [Podospora didyma]|uniref:Uncharacterized protein n=1 Tax=Podospora didyma TaxID=330526 RepID=A0AAE0P4T4_9PEZI|nr:hypothetical protein B0H63DRAFT_458001 [Podospora didyma]
MGVPVALATIAATGSIVTSIKSGWELRRMVKKKAAEKVAEEEAPRIFNRLRRAYNDRLMTSAEYVQWYEKWLVAKVERDLPALHRIRAHLRIIEQNPPKSRSSRSSSMSSSSRFREESRGRDHQDRYRDESRGRRSYRSGDSDSRSRASDRSRDSYGSRESDRSRDYFDHRYGRDESESRGRVEAAHRERRHSSSFSYNGDGAPYYQQHDLPWPPSGGNLEYFPEPGARVGAHPDQFIRLQKQATASYPRPPVAMATGYSEAALKYKPPTRAATVHFETGRERKSSRYSGYESDGEDDWYDEKRESRGRKR